MTILNINNNKDLKSIAVIGSGIAGLSAAWLLQQRHDVTVFEKQNRIGGHSNTVDAAVPGASLWTPVLSFTTKSIIPI